jgi:hypothetical protein
MPIKPTSFSKKGKKPLPEYEVIGKDEVTVSEACCVCDGPNSTCNPEQSSGVGLESTSFAAQVFAYWDAR